MYRVDLDSTLGAFKDPGQGTWRIPGLSDLCRTTSQIFRHILCVSLCGLPHTESHIFTVDLRRGDLMKRFRGDSLPVLNRKPGACIHYSPSGVYDV